MVPVDSVAIGKVEQWWAWTGPVRVLDGRWSGGVRKMVYKKLNQRWTFKNRKLSRCWVPVACLTWLILVGSALAAPASLNGQASKFALDAYCTEAKKELRPLAQGQISYESLAEMASKRAVIDHPDMYKTRTAWKSTIIAVLDQYGDEPVTQLCREEPGVNR
jgi:hypothetical protein